ncbi:hypothetical protein HGQ82_07000 [Clostridioides difficile]|uniref:hypothetical protein n=1 Tax=Clostridioides difficile TaxID=1496 RepID=UPI00146A1AB6|nr:hypothetical protein [Clostridioides difficile]NMU16100.1 hypothetical protein [Clostridioides difficile]
MHEISDVLKRGKINNILSYLIYATGENEAMVESYDSAIDESYETFFDDIESLYTDAHREDNELFDIISEFACVHDDIYFEAGMLVGFQLYKELSKKYEHHADKDIVAILEKRKQLHATDYEVSSALESFCTHRLNTALEESLRKDKSYQQKEDKIHKAIMRIDKIGLTHSQWKTVDRALSASNARNSEYGEKAYMQGFKDVVNLIITAMDQ